MTWVEIVLAVSVTFNLIILWSLRSVSRNPILAISAYCKRGGIENILLHVGPDGDTRQICPCEGCRQFLRNTADHMDRIEQEIMRAHLARGNAVTPMIREVAIVATRDEQDSADHD